MQRTIIIITLILINGTLASCGLIAPKSSLERVAKDWSMTVRASQVMPIYPLEEDIRPGDVYISSNSITTETETWEKKGFLPLVNIYARIPIAQEKYDDMFSNNFTQSDPPSFSRPPKAAFPSYTFSVDNRGSLGLAIPLNSVPVALSFAGAQSATGSVVFRNAASQGLPDQIMNEVLRTWASRHKDSLGFIASNRSDPTVLRIITRVFSIQGATVSLTFDEASGGSIQAGAQVNSPDLLSASETDYDALIANLNTQIELIKQTTAEEAPAIPPEQGERSRDPQRAALQAEIDRVNILKAQQQIDTIRSQISNLESARKYGGHILPGSTFKLASRSARGITMEETFDKPLILGYWAAEYLVLPTGTLIPVGNVEDLIENPKRYEYVRQLSTELAIKTPLPDKPDSRTSEDPFKK